MKRFELIIQAKTRFKKELPAHEHRDLGKMKTVCDETRGGLPNTFWEAVRTWMAWFRNLIRLDYLGNGNET